MSSLSGSWVRQLRPRRPGDLAPRCLPATWNQAVSQIGIGAAFWAVEESSEIAQLMASRFSPTASESSPEEFRPTCEAVVLGVLRAIDGGRGAEVEMMSESLTLMENTVRRRVPLELNLEVQRQTHRHLSEALMREIRRILPPESLAEALPSLSEFLIDHITAFAAASSTAQLAAERAWLGSHEGARTEAVLSLLKGEEPPDDLSRLLRYDIANRFHLAIVVTRNELPRQGERRVDAIGAEILERLGAVGDLVVSRGSQECWLWGSFTSRVTLPGGPLHAEPGVLVAVGSLSAGVNGIRTSHDDAQEAARVASLAPRRRQAAARTSRYEDVKLIALLTADIHRAQRFARDELGGLGHPDEDLLRTSIMVYLECNCSPAHAALDLNVAKNTVVYRVKRAESILGRRVKDHQQSLWAALAIAEAAGLDQRT